MAFGDWGSNFVGGGPSGTFNGTSVYVDVPDAPNLSFGNGGTDQPFSITSWAYMVSAINFRIASKTIPTSSATTEYAFATGGDEKLRITLHGPTLNNRISLVSDATVTSFENEWVHFAATYDGLKLASGLTLYVNALAISASTGGSGSYIGMDNTVASLSLGAFRASTGLRYADGQLCGERIYSVELDSAEVVDDMKRARTPSGLVGDWRFCDGEGSTVTDYAPSGNDGTVMGASLPAFWANEQNVVDC